MSQLWELCFSDSGLGHAGEERDTPAAGSAGLGGGPQDSPVALGCGQLEDDSWWAGAELGGPQQCLGEAASLSRTGSAFQTAICPSAGTLNVSS